MSKLVVFLIGDKIDYQKSVNLSRKIIAYCLSKNLGVVFNFLGYSEDLIKNLDPNLYFAISDDFLQLNSEYLNTSEIKYVEKENGKREFYNKFHFFDEIYRLLNDFKITKISLMISSDGCVDRLEDFRILNKKSNSIVEIIYKSIIENKEKYAYDFPDIIITSG